jgi:hypothetical protein
MVAQIALGKFVQLSPSIGPLVIATTFCMRCKKSSSKGRNSDDNDISTKFRDCLAASVTSTGRGDALPRRFRMTSMCGRGDKWSRSCGNKGDVKPASTIRRVTEEHPRTNTMKWPIGSPICKEVKAKA